MTKKLSKAQKAKARTRTQSGKVGLAKSGGDKDNHGGEEVASPVLSDATSLRRRAAAATVEAEESVFSKTTSRRLAQLNLIAAYVPLARPIPARFAHFDRRLLASARRIELEEQLVLPKRPRWNSDMDAKVVQSNEAEVFRQWLARMDALFAQAFPRSDLPEETAASEMAACSPPGTAIVPSLFERNLEVYRQLWRVNERSHITCVLLDSRCPLLHLPHSLVDYLKRFARLKTVLVLTKADIVPLHTVLEWKAWLETHFPAYRVVVTESYTRKEHAEGQGARVRYAPYLSPASRAAFFEALEAAHQDLVTPPLSVRNDPLRLQNWQPPCPRHVDWRSVASFDHGSSGATHLNEDDRQSDATPRVTIGLIGQPNVGKSSLLNALVGTKVVRASSTPGKTKHYQTHFLGGGPASGVQLCDSPGLVFPSLVGLEMQVLGAVLPISQVQALGSCVRFSGDRMPLERILQLSRAPDSDAGPAAIAQQQQAARTTDLHSPQAWTSLDILESLAARAGYRTAKAARWDTNRAGNALMRQLAEGKIQWAFRPPSDYAEGEDASPAGPDTLEDDAHGDNGIWLGNLREEAVWHDDEELNESSEEEERNTVRTVEGPLLSKIRLPTTKEVRFDESCGGEKEALGDESSGDQGDEDSGEETAGGTLSLFAALEVEGQDDDDDEDDSDDGGGDDSNFRVASTQTSSQ